MKNDNYDTYTEDYFEYVFILDIVVNFFISHEDSYKWQSFRKSAKYYAKYTTYHPGDG